MARTTTQLVEEVLDEVYNGTTSLTPYINLANPIVTRVAAAASAAGDTLTSTELELMETWLAAHFYTIMDPLYQRERTEQAEGQYFQRSFLEGAFAVDHSGQLKKVMSSKGNRAEVIWGGLPPSEQTPFHQRD